MLCFRSDYIVVSNLIFNFATKPTVGIDFISKTLYYDDRAIKLQLWDTAGQERFRSLIPSYIRDCSAAVIIFDVTSRSWEMTSMNIILLIGESSFRSVAKWIEDVRTESGTDVVIVLAGNKIDMETSRLIIHFFSAN